MPARWACIPLSQIGGIVCFLCAGCLYGREAGLMALPSGAFPPTSWLTPRSSHAETPLGAIPVLLPKNYVLRIDAQRCDFEQFGRPSYSRGVFRDRRWWHHYLPGC